MRKDYREDLIVAIAHDYAARARQRRPVAPQANGEGKGSGFRSLSTRSATRIMTTMWDRLTTTATITV